MVKDITAKEVLKYLSEHGEVAMTPDAILDAVGYRHRGAIHDTLGYLIELGFLRGQATRYDDEPSRAYEVDRVEGITPAGRRGLRRMVLREISGMK